MEKLTEDSRKLIEIVDTVNAKIINLTASTEEISASAAVVGDVAKELQRKFDDINEMQKS